MSPALPFDGIGAVTASAAESASFGFSVARLAVGGRWQGDAGDTTVLVARVAEALDGEEADTVILRFPTELVDLARGATSRRRFLHCGTLLYWEDPALLLDPPGFPEGTQVSVAGEQPTAQFAADALAVIGDSFDGYVNHYSYNPRIRTAAVRDGYVDWARRTIADPAGIGIVHSDGAVPVAAATIRLADDAGALVGEVELAGVTSAQQGSGRYAALWGSVRQALIDAGASRLIISTQASNTRVQRAWARLGLLPLASFDTVHAERIAGR